MEMGYVGRTVCLDMAVQKPAVLGREGVSSTALLLLAQVIIWMVQMVLGRGTEMAALLPYAGLALAILGLVQGLRHARRGERGRALNCVAASAAALFFWRLQMVLPHIALFQ